MNYDPVSIRNINGAHPAIRSSLLMTYQDAVKYLLNASNGRLSLRMYRVLATFTEQAYLYAQGRTRPGRIATWAKAGESFHNYGMAADGCLLFDCDGNGSFETAVWDTKFNFTKDPLPDWMEVIRIFQGHSWQAGYYFQNRKCDPPHFQMPLGYSWQELLRLHNQGRVDAAGYVIL